MISRFSLVSLVVLSALLVWPAAHLNSDAKHFLIRAGTTFMVLSIVLAAARSGVLRVPFLPIPILSVLTCLLSLGIGIANPRTDWTLVADTGVILAFFLGALALTRDKTFVRRLLTAWVGTSAVVCLYYWLQIAGMDPVKGFNPGHNVFGSFFGNRNFMAFYLVVTFPFALYLAIGSIRVGRALHLSAAALIAATLAVSGSRAGLGILVLSLPAYLWYLRPAPSPRAKPILWILLPISLVIVIATLVAASGRFASLDFPGLDGVFHGRLGIWRDTLPLIADRPWLGHGPGTFPRVFPDFRSTGLGYIFGFYEPVFSSHNVLLDMAAETGLLGALLFLALVAAGSGLFAMRKEVLAQYRDRAFFSGMALLGCALFSITGEICHVMFCTLFSWTALAVFYNSVSGGYREWRITIPPRRASLIVGLVAGPLAFAAIASFGAGFAASLEVKRARDIIAGGPNPLLAMRPIEKALALDPGNLYAEYQLGYLEMWRGRPRKALEHYQAIDSVHPHFENLPYNLGLAWLGLGEHRRALDAFSVTCRVYPTFGRAMEGMSRAYGALGMEDSALVWSERHARLEPESDAANPKGSALRR